MDAMDYEYESAARQGQRHHYAMRTGRGCPALAGQQPWSRSEWQQEHAHRPWVSPVPIFPPGLAPMQQWSPVEPTFLAPYDETRLSIPSHSHDVVPHSTPAFSPQHSPAPASVQGSAPVLGSALVNPPELPPAGQQTSPPAAEPTAQATQTYISSDDEARHSAPSPPSVSQGTVSPAFSPGPRVRNSAGNTVDLSHRHPASNPAARAGLPALSVSNYALAESRARHRLLSDFHRPVGPVRPRVGNISASPTSSLDEDSDFDGGPRMSMFGLMSSARQTQILRGQMPNKRVASRKALASLQKVDLDSLEDSAKTCVICYNDFGVASPEGTIETPLRLPKCKHVFGDNCILKWLEDSYSCPYCRDKLDSELAQPSEQFLNRILASTGGQFSPHIPVIRRILGNTRNEATVSAERGNRSLAFTRRYRDVEASYAGTSNQDNTTRGERRAAPSEDSNDAQRRQRPRHDTLPVSRPSTFSYNVIQNTRPSPPTPVDPMPMQSSTREPSSQRTPAWLYSQQTEPSRPPLAPQFSTHTAGFHFPRITDHSTHIPSSMPFHMPPLPQPSSPPSNQMPPMLSREDYYAAPPMIRGGWYNSTTEPQQLGSMLSSMEPQFPSFGSSPTAVTPGSGVFMPPLAHSVHYPRHVSPHGPLSSQPQLHHSEQSGNLQGGSYYMS